MNYVKTLALCTLLAFCISCDSGTKNKNDNHADTLVKGKETATGIQDTSEDMTKAEDPHTNTETNGSATTKTLLPSKLYKYVTTNLKGWEVISRDKWLKDDFRKVIDPENKLVYEKEVVAKADFNGDGKEDCVAFMINKTQEVQLVAFHQGDDGYEVIKISDEGKMEGQGALGTGISIQPAGEVKTLDPDKPLVLENAGFNYGIYGKSSKVMYYKDGKYTEAFTGD